MHTMGSREEEAGRPHPASRVAKRAWSWRSERPRPHFPPAFLDPAVTWQKFPCFSAVPQVLQLADNTCHNGSPWSLCASSPCVLLIMRLGTFRAPKGQLHGGIHFSNKLTEVLFIQWPPVQDCILSSGRAGENLPQIRREGRPGTLKPAVCRLTARK